MERSKATMFKRVVGSSPTAPTNIVIICRQVHMNNFPLNQRGVGKDFRMKRVSIGLIGFGTVGGSVVKILRQRRQLLMRRTGLDLRLQKICVRDLRRKRDVVVPRAMLTQDIGEIIDNPDIDIIVELIGGIHPAKEIISRALRRGKYVVTANKALLADCGQELFRLSHKLGGGIRFEAAVAGGIPIIKSLKKGLVADKFSAIYGIVNGTSNFVLSQMSGLGMSFRDALRQAQEEGFAEKDPTLDIEGVDSAHKLIILAYLAFGRFVRLSDVFVEGITRISPDDIKYAAEMGLVIKPLAIAKKRKDELEARVHPTMIPQGHLLASVDGAFNAVYTSSDLVGDMLFYGQGAGGNPTASAVVSDIVSLAESRDRGIDSRPRGKKDKSCHLRRIDQIDTRFYIRFMAIDHPGVLARISGILGRHNISIASVSQKERRRARIVPVVMIIHEAKERSMRLALDEINKLRMVEEAVVIRIEGCA
ncbi:MAG: homoserine dehydrogenase [Candidatus Omnitrophota bacterium]